MYARSTSLQAKVSSMDAGIDLIRDEVLPAVQAMQGCVGLSMMADRKSGRCIVTSAWESQDDMRASDAAIAPLRERAGKVLGGVPYVEEWEIAGLHRNHHSHQGACVRVVWMHGTGRFTRRRSRRARISSGWSACRPWNSSMASAAPACSSIRPPCAPSVSVTWDSRAAMEASRDAGMKLRATTSTQLAVDILDVAEFDLLVAHLRVPEMA